MQNLIPKNSSLTNPFSGSIIIIEPIKPIITANQRFISTFSESIAGAKIVIKIVTSCPRAIVFYFN